MWLLLEYDRVLQTKSVSSLEHAGIRVQGVDREEQLEQIDLTKVDLLLVGTGWQQATIAELRERGLSARSIYVCSTINDESALLARQLGCVDVIKYPLPVDYLKRWAPAAAEDEVVATKEAEPVSVLEDILASNQRLNQKRTYTRSRVNLADSGQFDEAAKLKSRGRIVAVHGARGGVGKSVLVALLARYMASRNYKVAVVDLDPKGNLLTMHRGQAAVTADEWSRLPAQMDEPMVYQSLVSLQGFHLLPSGKLRDGVDGVTLRRIVYHLAQYFDLVLLDTTPSSSITYPALELAHQAIIVMSPEWIAVKRHLEEYEALRHQKGAQHVVVAVNRIRKRASEHTRTLRLIEEANIKSDIVQFPEDKVLYRELMEARSLTGSRHVQDSVEHLVSALRLDPVLDEVKQKSRRKRRRVI